MASDNLLYDFILRNPGLITEQILQRLGLTPLYGQAWLRGLEDLKMIRYKDSTGWLAVSYTNFDDC